MGFTVLYVCTGNVCRSPMAELLLRALAPASAGLTVTSAGTHALVGQGMDPPSAQALAQLGVDPAAHRARQFEPWQAADADLVLTAERRHRDLVMTELPTAFRRTFTMREFARLARASPAAGSPTDIVARLAASRGMFGSVPERDDDVRDPYRARLEQATATAAQIVDTVRATIDVLTDSRPRPRPRPRPTR